MTDKTYPLHHTDAQPLYVTIPQEEYDRLCSENESMKKIIVDKQCDYCKNGKPLWESHVESIRIGKHPQTQRPSLKIGNRFNLEIECCPKCGRRLDEKITPAAIEPPEERT